MNKPPYTIPDQIALLKQRGMLFRDENEAYSVLKKIGYYRLKGYWWDMQSDTVLHRFQPSAWVYVLPIFSETALAQAYVWHTFVKFSFAYVYV